MTKASKTTESKGNYLRSPTSLRKARSEKGLSQALVAKELDVALSTFGGIERGDIPVNKDRADKISKMVGKAAKNLFKSHKSDKTKLVAV